MTAATEQPASPGTQQSPESSGRAGALRRLPRLVRLALAALLAAALLAVGVVGGLARAGYTPGLVWYDAQGRRIRPPAEPGIPALYYFLGPPREDFAESMEELVNHLASEALKSSTAGATTPKPNPPATPQRTQPSSVLATFPASKSPRRPPRA